MKTLPAGLKIKTDSFHLCLTNIQDAVFKTWEKPLLKHFTRHGLIHSEKVIQILGKLIEGHKGFKLNEEERFVLTAAAYLHDIGMQLPVYAGLKKKSNYSSKEKKTIRDKHNEASYKAIKESVKKKSDIDIDWKEECERFAEPVAIISKYHRQLNLDDDELKKTSIHGEEIRLRLLAALLRLADELDQDYKRIKSDELKRVDIPPESKFYWWSHKFVNSVDIKNGKIELYLIFPEGEKDQCILDAFEKNLYEKMNTQLNQVYDILDDCKLRLYRPINIAEKKTSELDILKIPDDLRSYLLESIVSTEEKTENLSRRKGVTFYLDGVPYSDDREVAESIKKIVSLMDKYRYKEAAEETRNFKKRELVTSPKDKMIFYLNTGNCMFMISSFKEAKEYWENALVISEREEIKNAYQNEVLKIRSSLLGNIGIVYQINGKFDEALKFHFDSIKFFKKIRDISGQAIQMSNIGIIYRLKGNLSKALKYHGIALKKHKQTNDKRGVASDLGNIGVIYDFFGYPKKALMYHNDSLKIHREIRDKTGEALDLANIGLSYQNIGQLEKSIKYLRDALKIYRELGNKIGIANQLGNIGLIYQTRSELEKALKYHTAALKINFKIVNRLGEAEQLSNIGLIYQRKGELKDAMIYHLNALNIYKELGNNQGMAIVYGNIGLINQFKNNFQEAEKYHLNALEIERKIGNRKGESDQLNNIGIIYQSRGDLDKALKYYEESLSIINEIGDRISKAITIANIGLVYMEKGKLDKALSYFRDAQKTNEKTGNILGKGYQFHNIGLAYREKGDLNKAVKHLENAFEIFNKIGAKLELIKTLKILIKINEKKGDTNKTEKYKKMLAQLDKNNASQ